MLNLKNILRQVSVASLLIILIVSCSSPSVNPKDEIPVDIYEKLTYLGFNTKDVKIVSKTHPITQKTETSFLVEGDIAMTKEAIDEMLKSYGIQKDKVSEQYASRYLVTRFPRTLTIIGYTGACCALTSKMSTALVWAVDNYNRLDIGLSFQLSFGTNYSDKDIVVYKDNISGIGGASGFPNSNGDPFPFIRLSQSPDTLNTNLIEHIITHNIGHSIGLTHSDCGDYTFSCGNISTPGFPPCFRHIPGTPTLPDPTSAMLTCLSGDEDGELGNFDVVALEYLY